MKYLFRINENENTYKDIINWNLINDIIDMSLDYIDNGCKLRISVKNNARDYILVLRYENYKLTKLWSNEILNDHPLSKKELSYAIMLYDKKGSYYKNALDLFNRAKLAYPNNILHFY